MNLRTLTIASLSLALLAGCRPSSSNSKLRRENAQLRDEVAKLRLQEAGDEARIAALESSTTRPAYTSEQTLNRLYTAHGLSFGRLTGGYKLDDAQPADAGVAVYVVPTDQDAQPIKAAGTFLITVFDLSVPEKPLLAKREFNLEESKANWYGHAMLFNYVLKVPFQTPPKSDDLLVRTQFTDELTGRVITADKTVKIHR